MIWFHFWCVEIPFNPNFQRKMMWWHSNPSNRFHSSTNWFLSKIKMRITFLALEMILVSHRESNGICDCCCEKWSIGERASNVVTEIAQHSTAHTHLLIWTKTVGSCLRSMSESNVKTINKSELFLCELSGFHYSIVMLSTIGIRSGGQLRRRLGSSRLC